MIFKIRASAIGQIMGRNGLTDKQLEYLNSLKEKDELTAKQENDLTSLVEKRDNAILPQTAKTYCEEWLKEQIYSRRNEFTSKYTDKGITMEDNSLDLVADHLGYGLLIKNEEYFTNGFLTGTPDAILTDLIIDVKNSWNCFTFPLFAKEIPSKDYWWQLQGYMALTGKTSAKLIYTLMDTPIHLIDKEFNWNNPKEMEYDEFALMFLYEHIDIKHRIKIFDVERDDEAIKQVESRVLECRNFIKTLL